MRQNFRRRLFEIINNVSGISQEQFLDLEDFAFLDLVNPHCFINRKNSVPVEKLELLQKRYAPIFNFLCLNSNYCLFIEKKNHYCQKCAKTLFIRGEYFDHLTNSATLLKKRKYCDHFSSKTRLKYVC